LLRKAVQFGAGNIGRGFLGQLFYETGYGTTFVDVVDEIVEGLNRRHEYPLRIVGEESETLCIEDVSAVHASDVEAVARATAEADFGATAVGVPVLSRIAPLLAAGIARRFERADAAPINFIVCENMIDAGPYLREEVRGHLDSRNHGALDERVGFVEASIGRMVPIMTEREKAEDPLLVCVEPYCELPVDARGFKGAIPPLNHMKPMDNFAAYVERKLFVHNMSHATAAYLGYLKGHEFIWQAIADPAVRAEVDGALAETCAGLSARHGMDLGELEAHGEDLLRRYQNKALGDQVARIAKDPIRKLGPKDRLIGSGLMCIEQGIEPVHVARGAAAALAYDHPGDDTAQRLQEIRRRQGVEGVFAEVCGIEGSSRMARLIVAQQEYLAGQGWL